MQKRGEILNINISNISPTPLYEQIKSQIQNQILDSTLKQGDGLPSIRNLAKELKVSIITIKRAYEELEKEGFIETITGKGTFVSMQNTDRLREITLYEIENKLEIIIKQAKSAGITLEEGIEIFKSIYEEV
jgi:GntR family transcriptional regulator